MALKIDDTARIRRVRLQRQSSVFAGDPEAGYAWLYITTGIAYGGLFVELDTGEIVGPYITGSAGVNGAIEYVFDGGGSTIATGTFGDLEIPFACTIQRATLLANQTGSIVIDIFKDTYTNYPPTPADSITASAKPTISGTTKSQDSTLTGWTTTIIEGDTLRFSVSSVTSIQRVTISLKIFKT